MASSIIATTRVGLHQAMKIFEQHRTGFAHDSHQTASDEAMSKEDVEGETDAKSLN